MERQQRPPITTALALAQLKCWPDLDHEQRRFAYETVSTMQRLHVPPRQYEEFIAWLEATAVVGAGAPGRG